MDAVSTRNLARAKFGSSHQKRRKSYPAGLPRDIRRIMEGIDVDVDELSDENIPDSKEADLLRQLAVQIISLGYRALSFKLHPDRGGSTEAMQRLNQVRTTLKCSKKSAKPFSAYQIHPHVRA